MYRPGLLASLAEEDRRSSPHDALIDRPVQLGDSLCPPVEEAPEGEGGVAAPDATASTMQPSPENASERGLLFQQARARFFMLLAKTCLLRIKG